VQTDDRKFIEKTRLTSLPALGFYRNGDLLHYDGNVKSETAVVKFLTDLENILLDSKIESVGLSMLNHISESKGDQGGSIFAFLYDAEDGRAQKVLRKLEGINDNLENDRTLLVKCSAAGAEKEYGIGYLPRLVHLRAGVPYPYVGDLSDESEILRWIGAELLDTSVKEVSALVLDALIEKLDRVAVVFVGKVREKEVPVTH